MKSKRKDYRWFVLLLCALAITIIQAHSALAWDLSFDNYKVYDEKTKTVEIWDTSSVPFIGSDTKLGEATLITPQKNIVFAGTGEQKVFEIKVNNIYEARKVIDAMEFYDYNNGMKATDISLTWKYATFSEVDVNDYEYVCKDGDKLENGTMEPICGKELVGTRKELSVDWNLLDEKTRFQKGEITIAGFRVVSSGEHIEWIPTLFGERVEEWAEWSDGYGNNNDKLLYLRMNKNGTATYDEVSGNYLTYNTNPTWQKSDFGSQEEWGNQTRGNDDNTYLDTGVLLTDGKNNKYTIEFRMNITKGEKYLMSNGGSGAGCDGTRKGFAIAPNANTPAYLEIFICDGTSATGLANTIEYTTNTTWHIALVLNHTNCSIYGNGHLHKSWNCKFATDQTANIMLNNRPVDSKVGKGFTGALEQVIVWNRVLTTAEIISANNSERDGRGGIPTIPRSINVTLLYPLRGANFTTDTITFNATLAGIDMNVTNYTLWVWDGTGVEQTFTNTTILANTNQSIFVQKALTFADDDTYYWNIWGCASNGTASNCSWATGTDTTNRSFIVDTTPPSVVIVYPTTANYNTNVSALNYTYSDTYAGGCFLSPDAGATNVSSASAGTNFTSVTSSEGSNTWTLFCNDTMGNWNVTAVTFWKDTIYPLIDFGDGTNANNAFITGDSVYVNTSWTEANFNNISFNIQSTIGTFAVATYAYNLTGLADGRYLYNVTICDTSNNCNVTGSRNVTLDNVAPAVSIILPTSSEYSYRNVSFNYSASDTNLGACWYSLNGAANVTIANCVNSSIRLSARNNSLILYANDSAGTVSNTSFVYPYYFPVLGLCNSTNPTVYANFTFKNETAGQENTKATIVSSWTYYLDAGVSRTLTLNNVTGENPSYAFCIDADNETLYTSVNILYDNAESYGRNYYENLTLTNNTFLKTLFLLPTALGQFVTFTVVDSISQVVPQAFVNISLPSGEAVESKLADDLGVAIMWLNPLTSYTIVGSKTGLTTSTQTYAPVLTAYTITLGGTQESGITKEIMDSIASGITVSITPTSNTLENNTIYAFNFTIAANSSNLDSYGFYLSNTYAIFASTSGSNAAGETLNINADTGTNKTFIMRAWFNIDGEIGNYTRTWYIYDSSGDDWSIKNLFEDLDTYSDAGIFGLTSFGLSIIIFLIILTITGIMAYKFSLSSPAMIVGILFILVMFFDVALGLIDNPVGAIPHFPTILIGLILAGMFFKEVSSG